MVAGVIALAGCQRAAEDRPERGSAAEIGSAGQERAACRPDRTCDPGLLCLSDLCVRPPAADCARVADQLASLELGNYAPREQRATVVAAKRAACETAKVSQDEAKCIAGARDRAGVARCVPRMFPEITGVRGGSADDACDRIASTMRRLLTASMPTTADAKTVQRIDAAMSVVRTSCGTDGWPDVFKACLLAATAAADLDACKAQMPAGLEATLEARMRALESTAP